MLSAHRVPRRGAARVSPRRHQREAGVAEGRRTPAPRCPVQHGMGGAGAGNRLLPPHAATRDHGTARAPRHAHSRPHAAGPAKARGGITGARAHGDRGRRAVELGRFRAGTPHRIDLSAGDDRQSAAYRYLARQGMAFDAATRGGDAHCARGGLPAAGALRPARHSIDRRVRCGARRDTRARMGDVV